MAFIKEQQVIGRVGKQMGQRGTVEEIRPTGMLMVRFDGQLWGIEPTLVQPIKCPVCGARLLGDEVAQWCEQTKFEEGTPVKEGPCDYALMSG